MTGRKARNKSGSDTRGQVLAAACEVFAERGFGGATIAEICEKAGANIATVNYYFHDKESLYVEAWREAFHRGLEAYPPDGGVPAGAPPAKRLRGRITALVRRVHDRANFEFRIVQKELAHPTGLLDKVLRECIRPLRQGMADVVRELLGAEAPEVQVVLCARSIGSQCMHMLMHGRPGAGGGRGPRGGSPAAMDVEVEAIADHVVRFSLAGIRQVRRAQRRGNGGGTGTKR